MLRLAQQKEREGAGIPGGCARRRQRAGPPLAQSPPPGKEEQGRRESERKGRKSKGGDELEGLRPLAAEPSEREGCQ